MALSQQQTAVCAQAFLLHWGWVIWGDGDSSFQDRVGITALFVGTHFPPSQGVDTMGVFSWMSSLEWVVLSSHLLGTVHECFSGGISLDTEEITHWLRSGLLGC